MTKVKKTTKASAQTLPAMPQWKDAGFRSRIVIDERGEFAKRDRMWGIEDPTTGRTWEWREEDHPGLGEFLEYLLSNYHPLARTGKIFRDGRKPGSAGPIRKAIARLLKKNPAMRPRELWAELVDNAPRGWQFLENRLGKYIEGPKAKDGMTYKHFSNIAKEERDKRNGR